jgi:hypothetical protein
MGKILKGLMLLLLLAPLTAYILNYDTITLFTELAKSLEYVYPALTSNISHYLPIIATMIIVPTATTLLRKLTFSRGQEAYVFAPQKKIKLNEVWKFDATYFVQECPNTLQKIINNLLDTIGRDSFLPLWVKLHKLKSQASYLLEQERNLYELEVVGKKSIVEEFVKRLQRCLDIYATQNPNSFRILKATPQTHSLNKITDVKNLRLPKFEMTGKRFFNWWSWIIVVASVATLAYLLLKSYMKRNNAFPKQRLEKERALDIASRCLERLYGVKPKPLSSTESKDSFIITFDGYTVLVDKSGRINKVVKDEK